MVSGLRVTFESCEDELFAHIWVTDGKIFGKARAIRRSIPFGAWITVPPEQQPGVTWYLMRHCGFSFVTSYPIDGVYNDVLLKIE